MTTTASAAPLSASPVSDAEVLFETSGQIGVITLNRPQALNALTLTMVREMNRQLAAWENDDAVQAVVIRGAGGRAFCAGGDVKAVALAARGGDTDAPRDFFREEYTLNHRIFTYPKPYIALVDGIVMGGGVGVSAHGRFRVVSENIVLAMPETMIGFFPDVGGGYFLPRCPGQTGTYLGLTGHRVAANDAVYIGYATHYVQQEHHAALLAGLASADLTDAAQPFDAVEEIISRFTEEADGESALSPVRDRIDSCFGHDSMEEIVAALESDGGAWADRTLEILYAVSPTSLKVTLAHLRRSEPLHFAAIMTMEYRLSQAFIQSPDFYEGIRAALIDKDRHPHWSPARLEEVRADAVAAFFAERTGDELRF